MRWLGVVLVLFAGAALYLRVSDVRRPANLLSAPAPAPAPLALTPANRVTSIPASLPPGAFGLAALTETAQTTFIVAGIDGKAEPIAGPLVVDPRSVVFRAGALAYLVMPGLDPTGNYIEVDELARGEGWQIRPEAGSAIFGFALDPQGTRLVYLEADTRVAGARIPWWVIGADLASGAKTVILDGAQLGAVAFLPLDWSPKMILLRGLTPFSDQHHGLWVARPDGSGLRQVATEADYVGGPRLALRPDGDHLALLASDPSALPVARQMAGAGEPPANLLRILDLRSAQFTVVLPPIPERGLAAAEWTSGGLLALAGEWDADRNAFVHRSVIELRSEKGTPPEPLYSTGEGEITQLAPCPDGGWLAAIQVRDRTQIIRVGQAEPVAEFVGPVLDWLACVSSEEAR